MIRNNEQEWTFGLGLRRAMWSLAWKSAICCAVWTGLVWLPTPLLNELSFHWLIMGMVVVACSIPGVAMGSVLGKNLTESAGFSSVLLPAMGGMFAMAAAFGGIALAGMLRPLNDWQSLMAPMTVTFFAIVWLVRITLFED